MRPPPKPKPKRPLIPFPDNPTPAGRPGYHKRPYSWKWYGYEPKKSKNKLERGFDEIEEDADEGLREIKAFARYGSFFFFFDVFDVMGGRVLMSWDRDEGKMDRVFYVSVDSR